MAVVDAIDDGGELGLHSTAHAGAEDLGDLVVGLQPTGLTRGSQPPQAELAAAFEQLVDREVALEDEVAAILDLGDGIKA
jgi:hypothetical protein